MPTMLDVTGLGHRYHSKDGEHVAVDGLTFTVNAGELVCIVGPSGCGKSTLLRSISGLIRPTEGQVRLHGDVVDGVPSDLAVVFQDYSRSLFPWLSVQRNVEFPLKKALGRAERAERARQALEQVGLAGAAGKYPWQLSGGMQQRVAIARALAYRPALLLMDEPFASVDAQTRFELEDLLLRVRREHDTTILLVTHDIDESVYLGDRVVVLSKSPARVVRTLDVDLPAQRDQITTRESEAFVALRSEVARLLHDRPAESDAAGTDSANSSAGASTNGHRVAAKPATAKQSSARATDQASEQASEQDADQAADRGPAKDADRGTDQGADEAATPVKAEAAAAPKAKPHRNGQGGNRNGAKNRNKSGGRGRARR
ncbi:NitT/TauT family transport system ATP-binding protein [Streptoalloteichus hindustanus]|uniref:NitT/TauT family transport system ATP-binding protein n=1 Tax=Streptoalloteichus hindustanus TaxID=2017 RepID=A0A1M4WCD2_STRHI|nr:NitT/TauT family transport system ATP-binding protein [Streptoalloteichus hindustanus]